MIEGVKLGKHIPLVLWSRKARSMTWVYYLLGLLVQVLHWLFSSEVGFGTLLSGVAAAAIALLTIFVRIVRIARIARDNKKREREKSRQIEPQATPSTSLLNEQTSQSSHMSSDRSAQKKKSPVNRQPRDEKRIAADNAAKALSDLSETTRKVVMPYQQSRRSNASYTISLEIIRTLVKNLADFQSSAGRLNKHLGTLKISWEVGDPRIVLYDCANPLSATFRQSDPETLVRIFEHEAGRIVLALQDKGYNVVPIRMVKNGALRFVLDGNRKVQIEVETEEEFIRMSS